MWLLPLKEKPRALCREALRPLLPSLILTVCRQGLIFIPLIFVLNAMFGLDGVIYAQPAADYLSIVVAILICAHLFRTMDHGEEKAEG